MPRKKADLEPEDPEPGTPGEVLPAMEDTVRKLSGIFSDNMKLPERTTEPEDDEEDEEDE